MAEIEDPGSPDGAKRNPGEAVPGLRFAPSGLPHVLKRKTRLPAGLLLERASVAGPHTMRVGPVHPSPAAIGTIIGGVESKTGTPSATPATETAAETTETAMPAATAVPTTTTMPTTAAVPCRSSAGYSKGDAQG
jgi:hypothetical protein